MITKAVKQIFENTEIAVSEYLPEEIRTRFGLEEEWKALRDVHFPRDEEQMRAARERLVFDEFLLFILGLRKLKESREELLNEAPMVEPAETVRLIEALPYELTGAQKKVWKEKAVIPKRRYQ